MREGATLKLDRGEELRVDIERDDLHRDEIMVRRSDTSSLPLPDRLAALDEIIAAAEPHPAGTTDRWLADERER
jgi:hypothetical protein